MADGDESQVASPGGGDAIRVLPVKDVCNRHVGHRDAPAYNIRAAMPHLRVNGDQVGVFFLKPGDKKKKS